MRVTGVRALPIVGAVFLCIGLAGLSVAGVCALLENGSGRTAHADGVIVKADYRALVRFTAAGGQTVEIRNGVNSTSNVEGRHVPVAYSPSNPQDGAVDSFVGRWFFAGLFALIASPMFIIGLAMVIVGRVLRAGPARDAKLVS